MRYHLATDHQLNHIFNHEKDCPAEILSGVVREMINRNMLNGYIKFIIRKCFHDVTRQDIEDLIQIGLIVMNNKAKYFRPGNMKPKNFLMMCVQSEYNNMYQKEQTIKRGGKAEIITGEDFDEYLLVAPINVERYVLNKIEIEECLSVLRDIEKQTFILYSQGYKQREVAEIIGYHEKSVDNLLRRARNKIRRELGYENQILNKQIS